jgi:hypothetical protein
MESTHEIIYSDRRISVVKMGEGEKNWGGGGGEKEKLGLSGH